MSTFASIIIGEHIKKSCLPWNASSFTKAKMWGATISIYSLEEEAGRDAYSTQSDLAYCPMRHFI